MSAESLFESERRLVRLKALRDELDSEIRNLEPVIAERRRIVGYPLLAKAMPGTSETVMRRWLVENGHDVAPMGRLHSWQRRVYADAHQAVGA